MSGKSARRTRQALSLYRLPATTDHEIGTRRKAAGKRVDPKRNLSDLSVDHSRRIRGLAKSQALTIQDAANRYTKSIGLMPRNTPKPDNSGKDTPVDDR